MESFALWFGVLKYELLPLAGVGVTARNRASSTSDDSSVKLDNSPSLEL